MICRKIEDCFNEIISFYNSGTNGYPLIVNIDDYSSYKAVLNKIQADSSKTIIRLSDFGSNDDIPNLDAAISAVSKKVEKTFVIGISQFCMLQSEEKLNEVVHKLLSLQTLGTAVILLNGCKNILKIAVNNDIRLEQRTIMMDEADYVVPKIFITKSVDKCYTDDYCKGITELVKALESMDYHMKTDDEIVVVTKYEKSIFSKSMYYVHQLGGVFEAIEKDFPTVKSCLEKSWGTQEQWNDLYDKLKKYKSLSNVINNVLSSTVNLSSFISDKFRDTDSKEAWYLFLAMKTIGTKENSYLSLAVKKSNSVKSLLKNIFMELLEHRITDNDFGKLYLERRKIISKLSNTTELVQTYCDHVGQYERDAIWYLTDISDKEKLYFLLFLNKYDYSKEEILNVTKTAFKEIYLYLTKFNFSPQNTAVSSNDTVFCSQLTEYFDEYKIQKLTNKIHPEFLSKVKEYAVSRPFNKLLPRTSIISSINKDDTQLYFFDALGVEYLSYILAKCREYGLQAGVHVGCCFLPSITSKNTEFKKAFKTTMNSDGFEELPGTKELDELKHHSKTIDYTTRPEPIHLFMELDIINKEIRSICEMLSRENISKVLIVSDHGASRLSVIYQSESNLYQLDNGQAGHSGRCCETPINPNVPEAAYENGYAVLANYDRFKGGRKANVEVHGGATLEETVIPVIEITKKPLDEEIYIVNPIAEFHAKDTVTITIFSNIPLSSPIIVIHELNEKFYTCAKSIDGTHYKFEIPEIKRTSNYTVDLYDENVLKKENMPFKAKKASVTTKVYF